MEGDRGKNSNNPQELEPLPEVIVSYSADTQTLSIHSGAGTADGEDMARGLTVFYDAEGNVAGFVLESTELLAQTAPGCCPVQERGIAQGYKFMRFPLDDNGLN
jgi:hypothetical protein